MVSKQILDKLKRLYAEKFEIVLSDKEARKIAKDFLSLIRKLISHRLKLIKAKNLPERR